MVCRILSRRNPPLKAGKGRAGALADIAVWAESARLPPFGAGRKRLLPAGASAPLHIKKRCRDAAVQPLGRLERSHQRLLMVAYSIPFQNPAPALLPPWRRPSDRTPRRRGVRPPPVPVCAGPARGAAELRGAAGSGPRGLGQKGDRTRRSTRTERRSTRTERRKEIDSDIKEILEERKEMPISWRWNERWNERRFLFHSHETSDWGVGQCLTFSSQDPGPRRPALHRLSRPPGGPCADPAAAPGPAQTQPPPRGLRRLSGSCEDRAKVRAPADASIVVD